MINQGLVFLISAMIATAACLAPAAGESVTNPAAVNPLIGPKTVMIGVVRDGPSWYIDGLCRQIEEELSLLAGDKFKAIFCRKEAFDARWDIPLIPAALKSALEDPEIDLVLVSGVLANEAVIQSAIALSKPVVSGYAEDTDLQRMPYDSRDRSTRTNFSFVIRPFSMNRDLETFRSMVPFKTVHIIADTRLVTAENNFRSSIETLAQQRGFKAQIVPADETAQDVLAQLGPGVEAVYLTPALRMPMSEWQRLIAGLNEKKIPSFSMLGAVDVERGVLAGVLPDVYDLLARRIALNLQQIILGASPNDLPVFLPIDEKLTLNARTAVQINFVCPIDLMLKAHVLHQDVFDKGDPLTLEQAMQIARENNVDIAIKRAETEAFRQDQRKAASQLLPQVTGNAQYQQMDANQARSSGGFLPQNETTAGVGLAQLIFSDPAFSQYRAAHRLVERMKYEEEANRLDVMATAGIRFLNYLSAKILSRIESENLRLTQSNLELTRIRFQAGAAGPEEVFRWEAQEARQRSSLIAAEFKIESARVALNQSLGVDQNSLWKTADIPLADDDYYFLKNTMRKRVDDDIDLKLLERFAVQYALDHAPALKALDQAIAAQRIEVGQLERKGYMPVVSASVTYDRMLDDRYADPTLQDQLVAAGVPIASETDSDKNEWMAAVQASLPLFEGGGRMADVAKAKSQLTQLMETRRRSKQLIEQETHAVLYALQSSQPNIGLSRIAADRAHKNLSVVRKKYAQGSVSILDLLDAQNQALSQDQAAAIAVYTYLQDVIQFQRIIAWFEFTQSEKEKKAFIAGMDEFWQQAGGTTHAP